MRTSDSIATLAPALIKARAAMKPPKMDATGQSSRTGRKYKYATLKAVIDAYEEPCQKHGLHLIQGVGRDETGNVALCSRLVHESGEWVEVLYPIPGGLTGQEMGSAISYGRRYQASALFSLAAEDDDDGAGAEGNKTPPATRPAARPAPRSDDEPPHPAETAEAPASRRSGGVVGDGVWIGYVEAINEKKSPPNAKKLWVKWGIRGSDGTWFNTFDRNLRDEAEAAMEAGAETTIRFTAGKFGKDLEDIEFMGQVEREPGEGGVIDDDIPF